jgi:hypothetical protein
MSNLLPKYDKFYDELEQLSDRVVSTAKQFESVASTRAECKHWGGCVLSS